MNPCERSYGIVDDFREQFERDRDRIIHCASFRRLEYKTQVFINSDGDNFRTRLTHSLEVSQIARTIAKRLNLNSTLAEAIALSHDLGHTPFGHIGGDALDEALKKYGNKNGFEHNYQSFRVLTKLEKRYEDFDGLNLTYGVLEGVLKHSEPYDKPFFTNEIRAKFELDKRPSLEAMIVDLADLIAYLSSDVEDAICNNIISINKLLENEFCNNVINTSKKIDSKILRYQISTKIITILVSDLIESSKENAQKIGSVACAVLNANDDSPIIFSEKVALLAKDLRAFLMENVYQHESVLIKMSFGERVVKGLFDAYVNKPKMLPLDEREKLEYKNLQRVVADYISSLSDRSAIEIYRKLF